MAKEKRFKIQYFDFGLLICVVMLVAFGLVMIYSASAYNATLRFGDGLLYVRKQLISAIVGFFGMIFFTVFDYRKWRYLAFPAYLFSLALCVLVIFTGKSENGSARWFSVNGMSVQPSEFAKIAVIFFLAVLISKSEGALKGSENVLKVFGLILPTVGAVAYANLSTAIIILGITYVMLFIASRETRVFLTFILLAVVGMAGILLFGAGYRMTRIEAWLHPENYSTTDQAVYQTVQALYAIGSGGLFGKGLGESFQKNFVPEAKNDMIFSIICEELGLFGAICVIVLYLILIWRLMIVALNAKDRFGSFICIGIMTHIALQVVFNIAVVTNTMPNTGVTLPFISYGGTAIIVLLSEIGLALGVSKYIEPV